MELEREADQSPVQSKATGQSGDGWAVAGESQDDWAAFSAAPSAEDTSEFQAFAQPLPEVLGQSLNLGAGSDTPSQIPTDMKPELSSGLLFESKHTKDVINDADSDWSGFAGQIPIQPDNISSDWSFKDNTSQSAADDVGSVSSGGTGTSNVPKTNTDSTVGMGTSSNNDEDEWEAFGAIDRSKQVDVAEDDARSRSSTIKAQGMDSSIKDSSFDFSFSSGPPPFSPSTPVAGDPGFTLPPTTMAPGFNSEPLPMDEHQAPTHNVPILDADIGLSIHTLTYSDTDAVSADQWSDFGAVSCDSSSTLKEQPPTLDSIVTPSVDDAKLFDGYNSSPPPIGHDDWGNFDSHSMTRADNDSPVVFSPPPLTDSDFSPLKSAPPRDCDWFTFSDKQEVPGSDNDSTSRYDWLHNEIYINT